MFEKNGLRVDLYVYIYIYTYSYVQSREYKVNMKKS